MRQRARVLHLLARASVSQAPHRQDRIPAGTSGFGPGPSSPVTCHGWHGRRDPAPQAHIQRTSHLHCAAVPHNYHSFHNLRRWLQHSASWLPAERLFFFTHGGGSSTMHFSAMDYARQLREIPRPALHRQNVINFHEACLRHVLHRLLPRMPLLSDSSTISRAPSLRGISGSGCYGCLLVQGALVRVERDS